MLKIECEVLSVLADGLEDMHEGCFPMNVRDLWFLLVEEDVMTGSVSFDRDVAKQWVISRWDDIAAFVNANNLGDVLPCPFMDVEKFEVAIRARVAKVVIDYSATVDSKRRTGNAILLEDVPKIASEWRNLANSEEVSR